MFTRADYERYFDEIARVERKMVYKSYDLCRELDEPVLVQALRKIGDDEIRHYGMVLKMLRHIADPERMEKRFEARDYALGTIAMKGPDGQSPREVHAYCVNLSKGGICLECEQELFAGNVWQLEIRSFDGEDVLTRRAKVVWRKQIEPDFYIAGFAYIDS